MKIVVSSTGSTMDSAVDPRFGRCPTFLIIDTETMSHEAVSNTSIGSAHGAGIGAAQSVAKLNAKAVITGNVGPNAHMALSSAGIEIYTGASGSVRNAVEMFKNGKLSKAGRATVGGHFGQSGRGRGRRT
ncbi:MAG: NifB/NifX family molybdenum-iron cluster-binding protein [Candidatus Bathyarchaeota archaeon]|nr:NifB/NifX family molybdenum-iron cluster-binding protein [Candidatus Bathyarchaeota archaeon]